MAPDQADFRNRHPGAGPGGIATGDCIPNTGWDAPARGFVILEDAIRAMEIKSGAGQHAPTETQGPSGTFGHAAAA